MSWVSEWSGAWEGIRKSYDDGRLAHAYIISGSPRGNGRLFTEALLKLLYCTATDKPCGSCSACSRVEQHLHPDVYWLEPKSKGRVIRVDEMRELTHRIHQTAYEGGWKAGVITYAERLSDQAANAFLKTLEEPPGQSLILLLTDAPQFLLPTIRSRCQRISLGEDRSPESPAGEDESWKETLMNLLRSGDPDDPLEVLAYAEQLKTLLDTLKNEIRETVEAAMDEDERREMEDRKAEKERTEALIQARLLETRSECLRLMQLWHRDRLMCVLGEEDTLLCFKSDASVLRKQAESLTAADALQRLTEVDILAHRLERNIPVVPACTSTLLTRFARG